MTFYGWKDKPWGTYQYLKGKLDCAGDDYGSIIIEMCALSEIDDMLKKQKIDGDNWYNHHNAEKAVISKVENSRYISLFYHIRCALAHGRFQILLTEKGTMYIMENGEENGRNFVVKARMLIYEQTLLDWIRILVAGPVENEKDYKPSILKMMVVNPSITRESIAAALKETIYTVDQNINVLKKQGIIVRYEKRRGTTKGFWVINIETALYRYQEAFE